METGTFDVDEEWSYFKEGKSPEDPEYQQFLKEQTETLSNYTWKDFNQRGVNEEIKHPLEDELFDQDHARKREKIMVNNIKNHLIENGNIAVITGASHIEYFHENLPNSLVPLRNT